MAIQISPDRCSEVTISTLEYEGLIRAAREAEGLKDFLRYKLTRYGNISHDELCVICAAFGIDGVDV